MILLFATTPCRSTTAPSAASCPRSTTSVTMRQPPASIITVVTRYADVRANTNPAIPSATPTPTRTTARPLTTPDLHGGFACAPGLAYDPRDKLSSGKLLGQAVCVPAW